MVLMAVVVTMLLAGAVAFAATPINTYQAIYSFTPKRSGTAARPQRMTFMQKVHVTPGTAGQRAGILLNLRFSIRGLKIDGKDFPTCSVGRIRSAGTDSGCPRGAKVATGFVQAQVGPSTNTTAAAGIDCDPFLHVWNAGQGRLAFFFAPALSGPRSCANGLIKEGAVPPWQVRYRRSGGNLVVNVPIPGTVDNPAPGLFSSLQSLSLRWAGQTVRRGGRSFTSIVSVACKGHTRPYRTAFRAKPLMGGASQQEAVSGTAPCSPSH